MAFSAKERPVRGTVHDDGLDHFTHDATTLVHLVEREQEDIAERGFGNGHGPAERMKDADFDGVFSGSNGRGGESDSREKRERNGLQ